MRKILLIILLSVPYFLPAQDNNRQRAESLAAIASQKERDGGEFDEFNPLFEQAIEMSPDYAELYILWGAVLAKYAERKGDTELMKQSFVKFEKSIELNPDQDPRLLHSAYSAWTAGLVFQAVRMEDESFLPVCFEKFAKAIELEPKNYEMYQLWGEVLLYYAKKKKDLPQLYETVKKYNEALEIEPNSIPALLGKGYAYMCMGRYSSDYQKYRPEVEAAYIRAEQLGGQSAAYNLACYYSLMKEKEEAFKWLEKAILKQPSYTRKMAVLNRDKIEADEDFSNIRRDRRYRELLNKYFEK